MKPTFCWRKTAPIRPLRKLPRHDPRTANARQATPRPPRYNQSTSSTPSPFTIANVTGTRRFALYFAITTALGIGVYCGNLFVAYRRHIPNQETETSGKNWEIPENPGDISCQRDVSARYNSIAESYDEEVGVQEWLMGMKSKRKQLIDGARGHVLEVSVGTGRNGRFYAERLEKEGQRRESDKRGGREEWDLLKTATDFAKSFGWNGILDVEKDIQSLTFVDKSLQMVVVAKRKWKEQLKRRSEASRNTGMLAPIPNRRSDLEHHDGPDIRWVVGDAERLDTIPKSPTPQEETSSTKDKILQNVITRGTGSILEKAKSLVNTTSASSSTSPITQPVSNNDGKYDTIVQTMGLCSTPNPSTLLMNLSQLLKSPSYSPASSDIPSSPPVPITNGGEILLLEHGRSHYQWLNTLLDNMAPGHADRYGCWWNRDIGAIVENAAEKAGLEIVEVKRWHLGSTWEVRLRHRRM
ncbi:putative ubiquinone menaquinone biosynthesis-related protein [Phaeomoniella chlamydospora]|uniref:Putative ubiquinone menaquinone biosynthesis-related protein n=1 Tax=Phaeomoniella chlamydospora TaxID=158046 RepID=A0A0G2HJU3_PHACM|nr:putative ubiquinone menaquinone biosynthesis-related protein [Phaeomoniella chlamydospora]